MSAAAVIILRRKRLIRRFHAAGALDPDHAVTLHAVGESAHWIFRQMVRHGVFAATTNDRYYMDQTAAARFLRRQALWVGFLAALCLLLILLGWFSKGLWR